MMRFLVFLCLFLFVVDLDNSYCQQDHRVILRAGKHPDFIRVVFSASQEIVTNATVILTKENHIRVDLKSPVELEIPPLGLLKTNATFEPLKGLTIRSKDGHYYISYSFIEDIKVSKLANPNRLVIDIFTNDKRPVTEESLTNESNKGTEPNRPESPLKIETVLIDAGHGGQDKGLHIGDFLEKDFVLGFSKELSNLLNKQGLKVGLTRKQDTNLSLKERQDLLNSKRYDLFLSLHVSNTDSLVIYPLNKEEGSVRLANSIIQTLQQTSAKAVKSKLADLRPVMFHGKGLPKAMLLIELPNPKITPYDKKLKDALLIALSKAIKSGTL